MFAYKNTFILLESRKKKKMKNVNISRINKKTCPLVRLSIMCYVHDSVRNHNTKLKR